MSEEKTEDANPPPAGQIPVLRSPRYQEFYANGVRLRLTPIDFTIIFGSTPSIPGAPDNIVQDEVSVTMTHSFMKVLSRHFSLIVQALEQELGPIKIQQRQQPQDETIAEMIQTIRQTPLIE
jgi:hypothetical protein